MLEFGPGRHLQEGDIRMAKKRFQAEQIIGKLREAEVEISKGQTIGSGRQEARDHRADVLPLAKGVRWPANRPGEAAQGAGEADRPAEAGGGESGPGY